MGPPRNKYVSSSRKEAGDAHSTGDGSPKARSPYSWGRKRAPDWTRLQSTLLGAAFRVPAERLAGLTPNLINRRRVGLGDGVIDPGQLLLGLAFLVVGPTKVRECVGLDASQCWRRPSPAEGQEPGRSPGTRLA
ncbi:MAG TPA: hypothetical protein VIN12_04310 [Candidatus Dormibacteraeota bacterium]